jgi:hypothetical protein
MGKCPVELCLTISASNKLRCLSMGTIALKGLELEVRLMGGTPISRYSGNLAND